MNGQLRSTTHLLKHIYTSQTLKQLQFNLLEMSSRRLVLTSRKGSDYFTKGRLLLSLLVFPDKAYQSNTRLCLHQRAHDPSLLQTDRTTPVL